MFCMCNVNVYKLRSYSINACTNVRCDSENESTSGFFDRFLFGAVVEMGEEGGRLAKKPAHCLSIQNSDQMVQRHILLNWLIALAGIFVEFLYIQGRWASVFIHIHPLIK